MPSAWVTLRQVATASLVATCPHSSTTPRAASLSASLGVSYPSRKAECRPGAQPTMPCGAGFAPTWTRDSVGSSAMTLHAAFFDLRNAPQPATQPPVPMPWMK